MTNEALSNIVDGLIEVVNSGTLSIADVAELVDDEFDDLNEIELLLLGAAIMFIGIGCVSENHGGRNSQELLAEMSESLEIKGGKWN